MTNNEQGPANFQTRPATMADKAGIAAVLNASSMANTGTQVTTPDRVGRWFHWFKSRSHTDTRLVATFGGVIVGYAHVVNEAPHLITTIKGAVHPDYRDRGIGAYLLQWTEQRAREHIPLTPNGTRLVMHSNIFDANHSGRALLLAQGFSLVRSFIHLQIVMDGPPPDPEWPPGVTVQIITAADWPAVGAALEEAFQDHWEQIDPSWSRPALTATGEGTADEEEDIDGEEDKAYFNTPGLCFIARAGEEVVGSCLCDAKNIEFAGAGRLGSLSVRRPWRRQGVGLALTLYALGEFYRRGTRHVVTDTDKSSFTGANHLYPKAGFTIFRQEDVYEKEIRPGQDWIMRNPRLK